MKNNDLLFPMQKDILSEMGRNFRLVRLRRRFTVELICERANISRATLWQIEKGNPRVSIGNYMNVAHALGGFDKDFLKICADDALGKTLVDMGIVNSHRGKSK